jgi:chemotaxis protein histidine kinase CheA/CheY-like chemotaxis protein
VIDSALLPVLQAFAEELDENAQAVAAALIASQRTDAPTDRKRHFAEVFRHLHTVKGNAGGLSLPKLEDQVHTLETDLTPYRAGEQAVPASLVTKVLRALDDGLTDVRAMLKEHGVPTPTRSASAAERTPASGISTLGHTGAQNAQNIRVSMNRLASLDDQFEELKEIRGAIERRAEDMRRLVWAFDERLAGGADRDAMKSLRYQVDSLQRGLAADVGDLGAQLGLAADELRELRTLPCDSIVPALERAAWEQASEAGKRVRFRAVGTQVALDRRLLEEIKVALMHGIRNAIDHGLEVPSERRAQGKVEEGRLTVSFEQRGRDVVVRCEDDGKGVDVAAVARRALEKSLISADDARRMTPEAAHALLFAPGFSTAVTVSKTSGRGVGLDVVKENVVKLGGRVSFASVEGQGATLTLELPLTLASAQVLLCEVSGHVLALPLVGVAGAVHAGRAIPHTVEWEGQPLEVTSLGKVLDLKAQERAAGAVVVLGQADRLLAISVDRLLGEREVVIRPIPPELSSMRNLTAVASLGSGKLAFVISIRVLTERSLLGTARSQQRKDRRRVMVCDDSISTRMLHRQVLEAAGFEVETAADGESALRALRRRRVDLLVSDVRMPRLDGIGLARLVRDDPSLAAIPIVLISSLDSEEDRRRALDAGATAYITKQQYERDALAKLARELIDRPHDSNRHRG